MTNDQNDIFTQNLPHVSPYSGLIPKRYGTNLEGAIAVIFEDDDKLIQRIIDVGEELDSLGIIEDQMKIARTIAVYHSAVEYCASHGYTMDALFPCVQQDFDNLGLYLGLYEATYDAIQESKFDDNYRASSVEDTVYVTDFISTFPEAVIVAHQPEPSEADEAVDKIRENLNLDLTEFEEFREI